MNQAFHVPIMLSSEFDATAALWTTVIPTTAAALGYYFVLRPLARRKRRAYVIYLFIYLLGVFSRVPGCFLLPFSDASRYDLLCVCVDSSARHGASCAKPNRT